MMDIFHRIYAATVLATSLLALNSCKEVQTESGLEPEKVPGSFQYNGDTYDIRSVVIYKLGNDTQIWISETAGYTTLDEIEKSVGELVITVPNAKLGGQKETFEQTGNFIRYDDKENSGYCTITCSIDEASRNISFEFSSQNLKSAPVNAISGSYNGPYSEYTEATISNQWAYERTVKDLTSATYIEMEDGAPSRFILYSHKDEAIDFTIAPSSLGKTVNISTSNIPNGTAVLYDKGEVFTLKGGYGSIKATIEGETLTVALRLTDKRGKTLRAEYNGSFVKKSGNKFNRCIYSSGSLTNEGETKYGYDGSFNIDDISISEGGGELMIRFNPGEGKDGVLIDMNNIPALKLSRAFINEGDVELNNTALDWSFSYHTFQVYSYDETNPTRTRASEGSILNISKDDNGSYTINLELSYTTTTFITQNKTDENGNVITELVQVTDDFGTPLYDENDDPIMKEVPVTEVVEKEVHPSVDLFFRQK